jgi:hypothetical protein
MPNNSLPFLLYHVDDLDPVETGFQPVLGRQGCLPYQTLFPPVPAYAKASAGKPLLASLRRPLF